MKQVMKRAGAGVPSANRITLLRGIGADGLAQTRTVFLQGLNSPFLRVLLGKIAEQDRGVFPRSEDFRKRRQGIQDL